MMEYRIYNTAIPGGVNVVDRILEDLKKEGEQIKKPLRWVGFEGEAGTKFVLNNQKIPMQIPDCGHFVTPFDGQTFMPVYSLVFNTSFSKPIWYII